MRCALIPLLSCLFTCFVVVTAAQRVSNRSLAIGKRSNERQAAELFGRIADSVAISKYRHVPDMTHRALGLLQDAAIDTLSPMLFQYLGDAYETDRVDSAAFYYNKSLAAYKTIPLHKKMYLQQSLLYAFIALDQADSIAFYIQQLEKVNASLAEDDARKYTVNNTIAQGYSALNQYEKAIQQYQHTIRKATRMPDSSIMLNAFVNIGSLYNAIGNNPLAIYYTRQAIPYLDEDPYNRMVTYSNLVDYYGNIGQRDSAGYFLDVAEKIAIGTQDAHAVSFMGLRKATLLIGQKQYEPAERLLQKSLAYFELQPPGVDFINCLLIYAGLDTSRNDYARADRHLRRLYAVTQDMNSRVYAAETLKFLAEVNGRLRNYRDAYLFQQRHGTLNDSINADKNIKALASLHAEYQTLQKEEQIMLLQKASQIKDLELQAEARNRIWLSALLLIVVLCFLIVYFFRQQQHRAKEKQAKAMMEMKVLRSQMNPHFIFNSLNSIQKYIWENRREDASEYLTKFSRLIRLVLEHSMRPAITLAEELRALGLYVEMERRRNNGKFDYHVTVSDAIDPEAVYIPSLLLQPYVENAIWHGLSGKDGKGSLTVRIDRVGNAMQCDVDDDGIGRERAATRQEHRQGHGSIAMNVSSQRIAWLQQETGEEAWVNIIDKMNGELAGGTTVSLRIPIMTNHDQ